MSVSVTMAQNCVNIDIKYTYLVANICTVFPAITGLDQGRTELDFLAIWRTVSSEGVFVARFSLYLDKRA